VLYVGLVATCAPISIVRRADRGDGRDQAGTTSGNLCPVVVRISAADDMAIWVGDRTDVSIAEPESTDAGIG
jgi:hypothetical protein